jgi:hypothetical protein
MRHAARFRGVFLLLILTVPGCNGRNQGNSARQGGGAKGQPARGQPHSGGTVLTEMKGVDFRIDPSVVLEVHYLRGALEPTHEDKSVWFDDPSSFQLRIDNAEIAVTAASMSAMMNHYAFAGPKAPLKDVEVEIRDGHLVESATLKKKVPIRSTLEGDVSATPEGDLLFHPAKIKAGDLPVKGLLDLFDIELSEMIKTQESRGVKVKENDLILDPERLLPPPHIRGRVTAVRIEGDRIVQVFGGGSGKNLSPSIPSAEHYMYFSGGELSFGKLTMHGADLQIIDDDPKDPFDFFLARYAGQLIAGTSHTMKDKGLVVYMPDSDQVGEERRAP